MIQAFQPLNFSGGNIYELVLEFNFVSDCLLQFMNFYQVIKAMYEYQKIELVFKKCSGKETVETLAIAMYSWPDYKNILKYEQIQACDNPVSGWLVVSLR